VDHLAYVFKAAVLSVVLAFAVGQNVVLLCKSWCDPRAAAASGCHREGPTTSPGLAGDEDCDNMAVGLAALLREDVRRYLSAPGAQHAVAIPRYQISPSTIDIRAGHDRARDWVHATPPLVTALRI
jgi:hypothetical protein